MLTNRSLMICLVADAIQKRVRKRQDRNTFSSLIVTMFELGLPQDPHAYVRHVLLPTIDIERELTQKMRLMFVVRKMEPSPYFLRQDIIHLILMYDDDFLSEVFTNLGADFSDLWGPWFDAKKTKR